MLLIKNGKILTMTGKVYESGEVLIENGKIKAVGEQITSVPEDTEVLDVHGAWVMPGIIEAHCHVGITEQKKAFEGDDSNETVDPVTPQLKAIDGINPMDAAFDDAVKAGITGAMIGPGSSNVVGGQFVFMKTKSRIVDELVVLEPAAMKVALGENPKKNYSDQQKSPVTRMAIGALLRQALFEAKEYKQKKEAAQKANKDFELDFKKECWLPVLNKEIPLKIHAHRVDDILTALRIAKLFEVNITLDHCSEGHLIADTIARSHFPAIVGPSMAARSKIEVQNVDFKTSGLLHKAGVKVAITTDHPVIPIQYLPICAGFAAKEGLGIEEGLKAITINAAEICGVADRVGSLEAGKDADIAIFDGNPMEVFTHTLYTLINGKILYDKAKEESQD